MCMRFGASYSANAPTSDARAEKKQTALERVLQQSKCNMPGANKCEFQVLHRTGATRSASVLPAAATLIYDFHGIRMYDLSKGSFDKAHALTATVAGRGGEILVRDILAMRNLFVPVGCQIVTAPSIADRRKVSYHVQGGTPVDHSDAAKHSPDPGFAPYLRSTIMPATGCGTTSSHASPASACTPFKRARLPNTASGGGRGEEEKEKEEAGEEEEEEEECGEEDEDEDVVDGDEEEVENGDGEDEDENDDEEDEDGSSDDELEANEEQEEEEEEEEEEEDGDSENADEYAIDLEDDREGEGPGDENDTDDQEGHDDDDEGSDIAEDDTDESGDGGDTDSFTHGDIQ